MNAGELRIALATFPDDLTVVIWDSEIMEPMVITGAKPGKIRPHDTRGVPDPDYPDDDYPGDDYPPHLVLRAGQSVIFLERE